jgi:two-component system NarL family response regulator
MDKLTKTEMVVLKFLVKGYENSQIAEETFCNVCTVKAHVTSILKKLNAKNRTQAAYIVLTNNLLDE